MLVLVVLILVTLGFIFTVLSVLDVPLPRRAMAGRRPTHRKIASLSAATYKWARRAQEEPAATARRSAASWKLLVAILLIAIGTALAALAAIRSILGLLEGMVS